MKDYSPNPELETCRGVFHLKSEYLSWGYSQKKKKTKRFTRPSVDGNTVYNSWDMETSDMSISR